MAARMASASPGTDDRTIAREEVKQAEIAFNLGHHAEAASLYEQAYRLVSDPILLYNIGQCHRLAHEPGEALTAYRAYLRVAPKDSPVRAKVEQTIDDLEWAVATQEKLDREASQESHARQDLIVPAPSAKETPPFPWKAWAPWVGTGLTAALAVAAIAEGISTDSTFNHLQDTCGKTKSCTSAQLSGDKSKATMTNVLWGLTAASAATTGVFFYLDLSGNKEAGISITWRH
jgi:tetratricopeptide (TPR) repeat protein